MRVFVAARGLSLVVVGSSYSSFWGVATLRFSGLLIAVASLVVEHRL